jgi:hypothetical protein
MLEIDTKNLQVLDSNGLDRTKSGFFVDNFSTQLFSDTKNPNYRASIDPQLNFLVPSFNEDNIRLIYDSDASTNVIKKGDNVYLKHSQVEYISQDQASKAVKINPFEAVIYLGDITLSPASDEWRETKIRAKKMVDGGTKLDTTQAYLWNNWQWNWGGKKIENLQVGDKTNTKTETTSSKIFSNVNKVVSEETLLEVIDTRIIDIALIPFMRSRKVYFKAQGLRPNSKVWAYFNGVRVDSWVREETFVRMSNDHKEYGNTQNKATQHPEGSSELITDANGAVEGSYFIPNTNAIRFRTGTQEFKILDISADNETRSGTIARALYASVGYLDTIDQTIKSTRVLNVEAVRTSKNRYVASSRNHGGGGREHNTQGNYYIQGTGVAVARYDPKNPGRSPGALGGRTSGGNSGGGRWCCSQMVHHGLWSEQRQFARLTAWSRKQPDWWRSGYNVWGKVIAKHLLSKNKVSIFGLEWSFKSRTDTMQAFYDHHVEKKPFTARTALANLIIYPGVFICGHIWKDIPTIPRLATKEELR